MPLLGRAPFHALCPARLASRGDATRRGRSDVFVGRLRARRLTSRCKRTSRRLAGGVCLLWGVREGGVSSVNGAILPLALLRFAPSALALQEAGAPLSRRFRLASPTLAGKAPMRYSTRGGSQPADVAADDALPDLPLDASERCASTCPLSGSRRCARGAPHEPCAFHGASLPMRLRPTCLPACSLLRYDLLR